MAMEVLKSIRLFSTSLRVPKICRYWNLSHAVGIGHPIIQNRDKSQNPPFEHNYDVVIGPVADSRVDPEIKKYKEEFSNQFMEQKNLKILAKRLKYPGPIYLQFCFCTNKALQFLYKD